MQIFSVLVKPASSLCNLRCSYCFYHDVAANREQAAYGIMSEDTVEQLLLRIQAFVQPPAQVTFLFQGGEPTLAGLDYYQNFITQCNRLLSPKIKLHFSIQTNGTFVDGAWCSFFKEHNFLVGVSWDGPSKMHDLNRLDRAGNGTFSQVQKCVQMLKKAAVDFNVLCVVTNATARHARALFTFFLKQGIKHLQLIPCLDPLQNQGARTYTLTPRQYGDFLIGAFDIWLDLYRQGRELHIRSFENVLLLLQGKRAEQCGAMGFCTAQFVVEADGRIYPCDFYVLDAYLCGNVQQHSIREVQHSSGLKAFMAYTEPKPALCASCPVYRLCGGGCKRYRPFYGRDAGYCPYQAFLCHVLERLRPPG